MAARRAWPAAHFAQRDLARVVRPRRRVRVVVRLVVIVIVSRGRRAALAVHPARVAVEIVLFLPDRQPMLDLVDHEAAGTKRLVAMRRARAHPDREIADAERAEPVYARELRDTEALARRRKDAFALAQPERLEGFVFELRDFAALV